MDLSPSPQLMAQYVADVVHIVESVFLFSQSIEIPDLSILMLGGGGGGSATSKPANEDKLGSHGDMNSLGSRLPSMAEGLTRGVGESTYITVPLEAVQLMARACFKLATRAALLSCHADILVGKLGRRMAANVLVDAPPVGVPQKGDNGDKTSGESRPDDGTLPQAVPPVTTASPIQVPPQKEVETSSEAAAQSPDQQHPHNSESPSAVKTAESAAVLPLGPSPTEHFPGPVAEAGGRNSTSDSADSTPRVSLRPGAGRSGPWSWLPDEARRLLRSEAASLAPAEQLAQGFNPFHHIDLLDIKALSPAWSTVLTDLATRASVAEALASLRLRHELRDEVPGLPYTDEERAQRKTIRDLAAHCM